MPDTSPPNGPMSVLMRLAERRAADAAAPRPAPTAEAADWVWPFHDNKALPGPVSEPAERRALTEARDLRPPDSTSLAQLYFAIDGARQRTGPVIVQFAGVAGREGVTEVADAFARRCARETDFAVLVLDCTGASAGPDGAALPTILEMVASGVAPGIGGAAHPRGVMRAMLGLSERDLDLRTLTVLSQRLRDEFAFVILDCPPLARSALSGSMSRIADGTIVVVEAGVTRRQAVARTVADFSRMGGQVIGIVLNKQRDWIPAWVRRIFL